MNEAPTRRRRQRRQNDEQPPSENTGTNAAPTNLAPPAPLQAAPQPQQAPVLAAVPTEQPKEMSSLERARLRSAELLEHSADTLDEAVDEFAIDARLIPDGWTYEWRRHTVHGQEDPAYSVQLDMKGWQPVPVSRHPELMPKDYSGSTIMRKGQILMERPKEITERARIIEQRKALDQVRIKENQLRSAPPGTFERGSHPGAPVTIGRSYEPIPVPKN